MKLYHLRGPWANGARIVNEDTFPKNVFTHSWIQNGVNLLEKFNSLQVKEIMRFRSNNSSSAPILIIERLR